MSVDRSLLVVGKECGSCDGQVCRHAPGCLLDEVFGGSREDFRSSLVDALKLLPPERSAEAWAVLGQWDNLRGALALISGQPRETKARKMEIARRALDGRYV